MALMNKLGLLIYNLALFTTIAVVVFSLKNFDFENPTDTIEYSQNLESLIYLAVGVLIAIAALLTVTSIVAGARKKGGMYFVLLILMWIAVAFTGVFTYANDIFKYIDDPVYKYTFAAAGSVLTFIPIIALILYQHPGSQERDKLVKALAKELEKEKEESLPYCPKCRTRVKKTFGYCPKCGTKFAD